MKFSLTDADGVVVEHDRYLLSLKDAGTPLQILMYYNTPITYALTAPQVTTLLGLNHLWADTGDFGCTYRADAKRYIDNAGQTEDDMTADSAIASGAYFQIGNTLYRATAAIATGETIAPGTNCTKTTFAAALNEILAQ